MKRARAHQPNHAENRKTSTALPRHRLEPSKQAGSPGHGGEFHAAAPFLLSFLIRSRLGGTPIPRRHHARPQTDYTTQLLPARIPGRLSSSPPLAASGLPSPSLPSLTARPRPPRRPQPRRHVRGTPGPATGPVARGPGRERQRAENRKGYTLRRCPMSWMRLAACWRHESSSSASTPQRRLGVFSSCSRVKNQREEALRPDAMTLPPPPAPSPAPAPPGSRTPRQGSAAPPHCARRRPRTAPCRPRRRPCACARPAAPPRAGLSLSVSGLGPRSGARDHNAPRRLSFGSARRWGEAEGAGWRGACRAWD